MYTIQKKTMWMAAGALVALASASGGAFADNAASPFNVRFDAPFVLNGRTGVAVQKVTQKLENNAWTEGKPKLKTWACDVKVQIEGRDIAKENETIGEHYFGSMDLSCKHWWHHFTAHFSRVMFLGIRQCVQSETVYDQDYCTLTVVALQNELDRSKKAGDLIKVTDKKREFYRIDSRDASAAINDQHLLPQGLNPDTIVASQLFEISIGKKGTDFFIKSPDTKSNFARGDNIFLTPDSTAMANDQTRRKETDDRSAQLAQELVAVQSDRNPSAKLDSVMPQFLSDFSETLKVALGIISPVEYFEAENRLRQIEGQLITLIHTYHPDITNRDQFRTRYADASQEYTNLGEYLSSGAAPASQGSTPPVQLQTPASVTTIERFHGGLARITRPGFKLDGKDYLASIDAEALYICRALGFADVAYADQWTQAETTSDYDQRIGFTGEPNSSGDVQLLPVSEDDKVWTQIYCQAGQS